MSIMDVLLLARIWWVLEILGTKLVMRSSRIWNIAKLDEVVFVQFIDVRLVLGSVSLSRHHKKIKWINTKIVEYGNYNRRNGVVWSAVVLITYCNSLPEAIFCGLKLFLRGYINDGVQAFTAWVGFIIKPSDVQEERGCHALLQHISL